MSGNAVTIRPYRQGDEEEIVRLLESTFASWPRDASLGYWRWKYQECPLGKSAIYVAEHKSGIVGTDSRHPIAIHIAGARTLCEQRTDLTIHPDFRGQGLFGKITERLNEASAGSGVKLSYAVESNPNLVKRWQRAGAMQPARRVINLIRIRNIERYAEVRPGYPPLRKLVLKLVAGYGRLRTTPLERRENGTGCVIETINRFDERADSFFRTASQGYDFIIERNRDYLNWRYCDPRVGPYTVLLGSQSREMLGYIVLKAGEWRQGYGVGHIVDLLALPGRDDVAESLIEGAFRHFDGAGVNEISAWMIANHPYRRLLRKHGLLDLGQNACFNMFLYVNDQAIVDSLADREKRVYLAHGDFYWV
jgi:hypothetical protein